MLVLELIKTLLDLFHLIDVFHCALFTGGNNQPLLALHQWNLRNFCNRHEILRLCGLLGAEVNKRAKAVVLAEIAAGFLVARGPVFELTEGIKSTESARQAIAARPQ